MRHQEKNHFSLKKREKKSFYKIHSPRAGQAVALVIHTLSSIGNHRHRIASSMAASAHASASVPVPAITGRHEARSQDVVLAPRFSIGVGICRLPRCSSSTAHAHISSGICRLSATSLLSMGCSPAWARNKAASSDLPASLQRKYATRFCIPISAATEQLHWDLGRHPAS
jgi:hypothetical protein